MTFEEILRRFDAKPSGTSHIACCPAHEDDKASLSINRNGDRVLIYCHAGCSVEAVLAAVGLKPKDLFSSNGHQRSDVYNYCAPDGRVRYRKVRTANKEFFFERPDGHGGWIRSAKQNGGQPVMFGITRQLYHLNELAGCTEVCIAEGEKDVDRLRELGLVATTNDGGAGKWSEALTAQLSDATDIWMLPDNDEPGRQHAEQVARSCHTAGKRVRIVNLPGLSEHGDVSDFLDAGHTKEELLAAFMEAPVYAPASPPPAVENGRCLTLEAASTISMRRAIYTWEQRVPVGMLSLLAGREGIGKSLLSQTTAADLTRGRLRGCYEGRPRGVIIVATEDAWEFVILPRLKAADADLSRCFRVNVTSTQYGAVELSLPGDLSALKPLVEQHDVALLLLDPIISRLGAKLDTHVDAEVRQALEPLRAFAEALRLSVLGIIHPNKSQAGIPTDPLNAIMGSRAFSAVSRSTLFLQADPEIARLYLLHIKNNVGALAPTLEFAIRDAIAGVDDAGEEVHAPQIVWGAERDAQERWQALLNDLRKKEQSANAPDSARDAAVEFLKLSLTTDPVEATTVIKAASEQGIVKRTLQRATEDLGVRKTWSQDRPPRMFWALPKEGPGI